MAAVLTIKGSLSNSILLTVCKSIVYSINQCTAFPAGIRLLLRTPNARIDAKIQLLFQFDHKIRPFHTSFPSETIQSKPKQTCSQPPRPLNIRTIDSGKEDFPLSANPIQCRDPPNGRHPSPTSHACGTATSDSAEGFRR